MLKLLTKQKKCQIDKVEKADKANSNQKADVADKANKEDKDHKLDVEAHEVDNKLNSSTFLSILSQCPEILTNRLKTIFEISKYNDITAMVKSDQKIYKVHEIDTLYLSFL